MLVAGNGRANSIALAGTAGLQKDCYKKLGPSLCQLRSGPQVFLLQAFLLGQPELPVFVLGRPSFHGPNLANRDTRAAKTQETNSR